MIYAREQLPQWFEPHTTEHHDALLEPVDLTPPKLYTRRQTSVGVLMFSNLFGTVHLIRGGERTTLAKPDAVMVRLAYDQPLNGLSASLARRAHLAVWEPLTR